MEHNFKKLKIWLHSMEYVTTIYKVTKEFPNDEKFGLTSQMRRCSISIPSNIAEGSSRKSSKHFDHFLTISIGSLFELQTQLILANDLGYLDPSTFSNLEVDLLSIKNKIFAFRNKILT